MSATLHRQIPFWVSICSAAGGAVAVQLYWLYHNNRKKFFQRLDFNKYVIH